MTPRRSSDWLQDS